MYQDIYWIIIYNYLKILQYILIYFKTNNMNGKIKQKIIEFFRFNNYKRIYQLNELLDQAKGYENYFEQFWSEGLHIALKLNSKNLFDICIKYAERIDKSMMKLKILTHEIGNNYNPYMIEKLEERYCKDFSPIELTFFFNSYLQKITKEKGEIPKSIKYYINRNTHVYKYTLLETLFSAKYIIDLIKYGYKFKTNLLNKFLIKKIYYDSYDELFLLLSHTIIDRKYRMFFNVVLKCYNKMKKEIKCFHDNLINYSEYNSNINILVNLSYTEMNGCIEYMSYNYISPFKIFESYDIFIDIDGFFHGKNCEKNDVINIIKTKMLPNFHEISNKITRKYKEILNLYGNYIVNKKIICHDLSKKLSSDISKYITNEYI
jgi:hypothetical protein